MSAVATWTAANTAVPHPPSTSQKVPITSAAITAVPDGVPGDVSDGVPGDGADGVRGDESDMD
ncbi:hypothetical protein GCM10009831_32200 [Dietzia cercidiphylli]|uniref:ATP-grasp-modified RiPP n=1 Tax=Dietzia cercidiphylli TaxID=498199 RepID=A0ABP4V7W7_9ACTN